jgi:putative ABC transport system substrate-binding protein
MAACGGGAATQTANRRVLWREHGCGREIKNRCFYAAVERARLDRGPDSRDRVSLGGEQDRFPEIAADLVRLRVDTIVATSIAAALACKQATAVIPIVFPLAGDPLGTGLVTSLARPGGNVTGLSNQGADLAGKRLEVLREVNPELRKLAVLANAEYAGRISELADIQTAARTLGLDVAVFEIRPGGDIASVFKAMDKEGAEALYVVGDTFMNSNRVRISSLAIQARLPTIYVAREYVEAGGLLSYGANIPHLFARAAELVDKILRGTKPGDIPVEQPTKFELVVNLKTAKALGLTVPPTLLARADEVIE